MSVSSLATHPQTRRPHRSHSAGISNLPSDTLQPSLPSSPSSSRPSSVKGRSVADFQEIALRPAPVPVYTGRLKNRPTTTNLTSVYSSGYQRPPPAVRAYSGPHGFGSSKQRFHNDSLEYITHAGRYTVDNPGYDDTISKLLSRRIKRAGPQIATTTTSLHQPRNSSRQLVPPSTYHRGSSSQHRPQERNVTKRPSFVTAEEARYVESFVRPVNPESVKQPEHQPEPVLSLEEQQDLSTLYALAGAFLAANPAEEVVPIVKYNKVVQMLNESWEELSKDKPDTSTSSEFGSSATRGESAEELGRSGETASDLRRTFSVPPTALGSTPHLQLKRSKSVGPRSGLSPPRKENKAHSAYPQRRISMRNEPLNSKSRRPPAKGILRHPLPPSQRFGTRARFDESHLFQNTVNSRLRKIMRDLEPEKLRSVPRAKLAGRPVEFRQRTRRIAANPSPAFWAPVSEGDSKRIYYPSEEASGEHLHQPAHCVDGNSDCPVPCDRPTQRSSKQMAQQMQKPVDRLSDDVATASESASVSVLSSSMKKEEMEASSSRTLTFSSDDSSDKVQHNLMECTASFSMVSCSTPNNTASAPALGNQEAQSGVSTDNSQHVSESNLEEAESARISIDIDALSSEDHSDGIQDATVVVTKEKMNTTKTRKSNVPAFASGKPLFNLLPISFYDPDVARARTRGTSNTRQTNIWSRARGYFCMSRRKEVDPLDQLEAQHSNKRSGSSRKESPITGSSSSAAPSSECTNSQARTVIDDDFENSSEDLVDFEDLSYAPEIGVGSLRLTEREGYFEPEKRLCRPSY